jgi:hypothetical protein
MEAGMAMTQLRTPILTDGIQSIYFFNGRLLSAEDLSQEQVANLQARRLLGKAIGDGVGYGLEVKQSAGISTRQEPVVTVSAGLALNREGNTLQLKSAVDIALVRPKESRSGTVTTLFADCQPIQKGAYVVGKGVYLLTIQAASGKEGRAPVSGLGNLDAACNAKYSTDGIQFRLIQVAITPTEMEDAAHLRNHLAYRCFGSNDGNVTSFFANPFGPGVTRYGLLDELRLQKCLMDDEVPLALIYWTLKGGIEFVDMWSVRRRITQRSANLNWQLLISDRLQAESEAIFQQFEDQVENIRATETNSLNSIIGTDRFKFLPPVGIIPITGTNSPSGFNQDKFFGSLGSKDLALLDARLMHELLHESLYHGPIDLSHDEKVQLYLIYENVLAVEQQQAQQLVLVFATIGLPYRGIARFGRAKWTLSRFSPRII